MIPGRAKASRERWLSVSFRKGGRWRGRGQRRVVEGVFGKGEGVVGRELGGERGGGRRMKTRQAERRAKTIGGGVIFSVHLGEPPSSTSLWEKELKKKKRRV